MTLIVQVRGTSGSGKSTAVRSFMETLEWDGVTVPGRKRPLYYRSFGPPWALVLGHYESACGGCDTIGSARAVYELTVTLAAVPGVELIVQEGLLLSEDAKWTTELAKAHEVRILFLTTPLDRCLTWVKSRRAAAGNDKPLNPANTANRVSVIERARVKLLGSGVACRRCSAEQASGLLRDIYQGVMGCKTKRPG